MLIDVNKYVNLVFEKLNNIEFYSEVDLKDLEKTITAHLKAVYDDKIEALSLQFDIDRHKGLPIDSDRYKEEYAKIRREIMAEAYEISLSDNNPFGLINIKD